MKQPILYIVFISLLLVLGTIFFGLPQYREFNDLQFKLSQKKEELQNKERYFEQLELLLARLKDFPPELAKIESSLPPVPDVSGSFNFIERTALQNGLILESVTAAKTAPFGERAAVLKTQLSFSLSGSYASFKNFLAGLQTSSRLVSVEEISFEAPEEGQIFTFNLKVGTYSH